MLVCNGRQLLPIFLVPRQFPEIVSTVLQAVRELELFRIDGNTGKG